MRTVNFSSRERDRLFKERLLLEKQYEFFNQFYFNEAMGNVIASLINEMNDISCVCQKITCEIEEHDEEIEKRIPGSKIKQTFIKHCHKKRYVYIAILPIDLAKDNFTFSCKREMDKFLKNETLAYTDFFGIFYPRLFCEKFPYLDLFFQFLNKHRLVSGLIVVDDDLLYEASSFILNNSKNNFVLAR